MNQKGFAPVIFISIIFLISVGIVGGAYIIKNSSERYKIASIPITSSTPSPISTKQIQPSPPVEQVQPHVYLMPGGKAMLPNYVTGQIWLYDEYKLNKPERFDVIVLKKPNKTNIIMMERIIGLPNEKIEIKNKEVYINDKILDESKYLLTPNTVGVLFLKENQEYTIPENNYFVLGDNRDYSMDSREYGPVPVDNMIGKITTQIQKIDVTKENCNCWDNTNNLCLPQVACQ